MYIVIISAEEEGFMKKMRFISGCVSIALSVIMLLTGCGELDSIDEVVLDLDGTMYDTTDKEKENKEEEITVAFIFDGLVNDGGYTQMHNNGRIEVEKMSGVKTIYKENIKDDKDETEKICEEFIKNGATIIYGTSFGHLEGMAESAKKHPDIKYIHCSGNISTNNMSSFFGKIYQMRYLTGIAAGSKTQTNKIGYVAAYPIPEVIRGINAFAIGARSVNPDVVVEVEWTYTWDNEELERKTAEKLIKNGADVIAQHQNTTGAQKAAEAANIYSIGYNRDMSYANPNQLTSAIWNWGIYYTACTQNIIDNKWKSEVEWLDASSGLVDISPLSEDIDDEIKKLIESEKQNIKNNKDTIFKGPLYNQNGELMVVDGEIMAENDIYNMDWFIDCVKGSIN